MILLPAQAIGNRTVIADSPAANAVDVAVYIDDKKTKSIFAIKLKPLSMLVL